MSSIFSHHRTLRVSFFLKNISNSTGSRVPGSFALLPEFDPKFRLGDWKQIICVVTDMVAVYLCVLFGSTCPPWSYRNSSVEVLSECTPSQVIIPMRSSIAWRKYCPFFSWFGEVWSTCRHQFIQKIWTVFSRNLEVNNEPESRKTDVHTTGYQCLILVNGMLHTKWLFIIYLNIPSPLPKLT